jgi:hypothetical protein
MARCLRDRSREGGREGSSYRKLCFEIVDLGSALHLHCSGKSLGDLLPSLPVRK